MSRLKSGFPRNLQTLVFGNHCNSRPDQVELQGSLHVLTFGCCFNQSLHKVTLPRSSCTDFWHWLKTRAWSLLFCPIQFKHWIMASAIPSEHQCCQAPWVRIWLWLMIGRATRSIRQNCNLANPWLCVWLWSLFAALYEQCHWPRVFN